MNEKIEQAKDKIAQGYGYNDWKGLEYHYQIMLKSFIPKAIWNQVAERYHELMDEWISVAERLPEVDNTINTFGQRVECLVFWENDVYKGTYVNLGTPFWSVSHVSSSSSLKVTHWKPLPNKPKQ